MPHIEGVLPKGPYLPCVSMAGRARLAGYPRYMRHWIRSALVQIMAWRLFDAKPLSKPMLAIVNWTLRNKLQWNFKQNTRLFINKNAFENIVCEIAVILSRERWVNAPAVTTALSCSFGCIQVHHHQLHCTCWMQPTKCTWHDGIASPLTNRAPWTSIIWKHWCNLIMVWSNDISNSGGITWKLLITRIGYNLCLEQRKFAEIIVFHKHMVHKMH